MLPRPQRLQMISSAHSIFFCAQVLRFCCRHSLFALCIHLHGFLGPDPWLFSFLFIICQLIDLQVYEVFDSNPRVVRYFWWYHYTPFRLFIRLDRRK